jgi:hypothetical protein
VGAAGDSQIQSASVGFVERASLLSLCCFAHIRAESHSLVERGRVAVAAAAAVMGCSSWPNIPLSLRPILPGLTLLGLELWPGGVLSICTQKAKIESRVVECVSDGAGG